MAVNNQEKIRAARELCEKARWPDVLAFAAQWQSEHPGDAKALFYQGSRKFRSAGCPKRRRVIVGALAMDATDYKTGIIWQRCC
ncbi:MAG: hypothetical protein WDN00_02685 [Limisphaerales bacterium]